MIIITGRIQGDVDKISFEPTAGTLRRPNGTSVISKPIYARIARIDGIAQMSVQLPDNTELLAKRWQWLCVESRQGKLISPLMFAFSAEPAELRYADIRPLGRGLS